MYEVWYLDKKTAAFKAFDEASSYSIGTDIEFKEKTKVVVPNRPDLQNDDFVVLRDGKGVVYQGICSEISVGKAPYTLTLKPLECIFDRTIYVSNEDRISLSDYGIEWFIYCAIRDNFVNSGDAMFDKTYIRFWVPTHTARDVKVSSIVDTDNGIYNLKTFLGNVLELYGIRLGFTFGDGYLTISIYNQNTDLQAIDIDTNFSDIIDYEETYTVDVLAKLNVKWGIPDNEASYVDEATETLYVGNALADIQYFTFYLQNDRTITDDPLSTKRVDGTVKTVYIETEDENELIEQVIDEFASNKYEHKITFKLSKNSKLYSYTDFIIGRPVRIKSKKTGLIKESIITKITESSGSDIYTITIGKLAVTLIDKIRRL